jgi:hypothetical protein
VAILRLPGRACERMCAAAAKYSVTARHEGCFVTIRAQTH